MFRIVAVHRNISILLRRCLVQESSRRSSHFPNVLDDRFDQLYFLVCGRVGMIIVRVHRCEQGPEAGVPRIRCIIETILQDHVIASSILLHVRRQHIRTTTTNNIILVDFLFRNHTRRPSTKTLLWRSCILSSSSRRVLPFPRSWRTRSGTSSTGTLLLTLLSIRKLGGRRGGHVGTCSTIGYFYANEMSRVLLVYCVTISN